MEELRYMDVPTRAKAFKARADAFFIEQVDQLHKPSVWTPFPLAVMTCVGIEMISSYKYGDARGDSNNHFKRLVEEMDVRFEKENLTPESKSKKLSYFVYKGFRNSLAHGFYGKWVFITHDPAKAKTFRYSPQKCLVVLNVYWFYQQFKDCYNDYFKKLLAASNPKIEPLVTFNKTLEKNFEMWVSR
jgi:hypothetical protein